MWGPAGHSPTSKSVQNGCLRNKQPAADVTCVRLHHTHSLHLLSYRQQHQLQRLPCKPIVAVIVPAKSWLLHSSHCC